jgi:hypothetical protein
VDARLPLRGLSGVAFLLMIVPAIEAALAIASPQTTVGIRGELCPRIDRVLKDSKYRSHLWVNRRNALGGHPGWLIRINATSTPLTRAQIEAWLKSEYRPLETVTPRGLIDGIQKAHGLLGFSLAPEASQFELCLVLPTQ